MLARFNRIGWKLSLLGSVFILGIIGAMTRIILRQGEAAMTREMGLRAESLARSCSEALFPTEDRFTLHFNTLEMMKQPAVVYVSVLDPQGRILSHSDPGAVGGVDAGPEAWAALLSTGTLVQRYARSGVETFDIAAPMSAAGRRLGVVRLGFTRASVLRALGGVRRQILWVAAAAVAIAVAGAILIVGWMLRPLKELSRAAREVGAGSLEVPILWTGGDEIGMLAEAFRKMLVGLCEREQIRRIFGRFVSPEVAERAVSGRLKLGGERRAVSLLVADIRGFTTFSEKLPPEEVVAFLNTHFSRMVEIVRRHHGSVDKFIGDAVFAVFGAPVELSDHAARSAACALEIREHMARFNEERRRMGKEPVGIGVAIHSGEAVAGTIGSAERMEYTLIGDAVNLAFRIEGLNVRLGTEILVSQETYRLTRESGFEYKPWGLTPIRGRTEPVYVYELLGGGAERGRSLVVDERRRIYRRP